MQGKEFFPNFLKGKLQSFVYYDDRYRLDNSWHRAIVDEAEDDQGEVTVIFVDYGRKDSVDKHDVRLNIMLEEIPVQAIRCVLHNIRPPGGVREPTGNLEWPLLNLNHLHSLIVDQEFRVRVKRRGSPIEVSLKNECNSIAKLFVMNEMAEYLVHPSKKKSYKKKKNAGAV